MSIVLKDGTVLPDIPTAYTDDRFIGVAPDLATLKYHYVCFWSSTGNYYLTCSDIPVIAIEDVGAVITALVDFATQEDGLNYSTFVYNPDEGISVWTDGDSGLVSENGHMWFDSMGPVVWADYDINFVDPHTGEPGEIYFPSSVSKPPFILPDGTELPALPDGCFDGTPYGAIVGVDWMGNGELFYSLQVMSTPILALPAAMVPEDSGITPGEGVTHVIAMPPCTSKVAGLEEGKWSDMEAEDITEFTASFGIGIVLWANHDLCEVTELNEDMSYKVGSTVVRKSDENYRVTGGYMTSIANEARRLGGKTGGMLPAVTEATLRGVTGGEPELQEKTVTPTSAVQVVVPDEGYDGLSKVTVEAVSGGGGSMFQTSASGRIPVYQSGTAESVLNADDISFATSAVGALK